MFNYQTEAGPARGYLALPKGRTGPGVLVLHAWWGLTEAFTGVADRLAAEGFVALAPDLYQGRTAKTIDEAKALMETGRDMAKMEAAARGAVAALQAQPAVRGKKLGALGFSMGGEWAGLLSEWYPDAIKAVVLYYGATLPDFEKASAAYQGHFADPDEWEDIEWVRKMEAAMKAAGREATLHFYQNVGHWFFEPNQPAAYNAEAAELAWRRTLTFLREKLGGQTG